MDITELKNILDEIPDSDEDMEVVIVADHGQDLTTVFRAEVVKASKDGGEYFEINPDDLKDFEDNEIHRIFLIEG